MSGKFRKSKRETVEFEPFKMQKTDYSSVGRIRTSQGWFYIKEKNCKCLKVLNCVLDEECVSKTGAFHSTECIHHPWWCVKCESSCNCWNTTKRTRKSRNKLALPKSFLTEMKEFGF